MHQPPPSPAHAHQPEADASPDLLAFAVGNTRVRVGLFRAGQLHRPFAVRHDRPGELASQLAAQFGDGGLALEPGRFHVAVATVSEPAAGGVDEALREAGLKPIAVSRVGRDLAIPIPLALRDSSTVGHDRLLNALGAYRTAQQACVVVDAGTAVTVDLVDGEGTFQGGVIAPGLSMMLGALHERTAALPKIDYEPPAPDEGPLGKDTPSAMRLGVAGMVLGLVRLQLERYADLYGAYPQVVATGGDAPVLFEHDEVIEHIVPDLQLMGIHAAVEVALASEGDEAGEDA